jgi:hypothetical protein
MTKRLKAKLEEAKLNTYNWSQGLMYYFKPVRILKRKAVSELELWSECEMLDKVLTIKLVP